MENTRGKDEAGNRKLTLKSTDHSSSLQKHLHKQWMQGQNCDLVISAGSCHLSVHSCVLACFSTKISQHLIRAEMDCSFSFSMEQKQYRVTDDGVSFCFLKTGEKKVGIDVDENLVKALVGYMYTGYLSVQYHQVVGLLRIAQLLDVNFIVNIIEMFISRNPEVVQLQTVPVPALDLAMNKVLPSQLAISEQSCMQQTSCTTSEKRCSSAGAGPQSDDTNQSCTPVEVLGDDRDGDDVPLYFDVAGLNVKSETVDADLKALLDFSAEVEGKETIQSVTGDKSPQPDLERDAEEKREDSEEDCIEVEDSVEKMVEVKQEVLDNSAEQLMSTDLHTGEQQQQQQDTVDPELDLTANSCSDDNNDSEDNNEHGLTIQESDNCEVETAAADAGAFVCMYCKQSYSSQANLKRHVLRMHKRKKFSQKTCPNCDVRFEEREDLKSHCREVHGNFVCEVKECDYWTVFSSTLRGHQTRVHNMDKVYPCSECNYQASSRRALRTHHANSHVAYPCPICHQKFLLKKKLILHQRAEHRSKPERKQLKERGEVASQDNNNSANAEVPGGAGIEVLLAAVQSDLCHELDRSPDVKDMDMHVPSREVSTTSPNSKRKSARPRKERVRISKCRLCCKKHVSKEALYQHLRDEHCDDCFSCQHCPKSFIRKERLTYHDRVEHQGRSWTCSYCGKAFVIAAQFSAHCITEHQDLKPFHCQESPSCHYKTAKVRSIESHKVHVHAKERNVICDKCGGCFPTDLYLRLHQRTCLRLEQHLCSVCGAVFNLRQSMLNHIKIKHGGERRYRCALCGKRFSCHSNLMRHMRIHNNTFPYVCEICGQKFRHSNSLKDHVRRKHATGK